MKSAVWDFYHLLTALWMPSTRRLKWPGCNCVQLTCNTPSVYHVQHIVRHKVQRGSSASESDNSLNCIYFSFTLLAPSPTDERSTVNLSIIVKAQWQLELLWRHNDSYNCCKGTMTAITAVKAQWQLKLLCTGHNDSYNCCKGTMTVITAVHKAQWQLELL